MQYAIHEDFYPEVEKKLYRVAKKCQKFGNDFKFDVVGNVMREKNGAFHKFILIDVEGIAQVNGWEFIAAMDILDNGNVIRRYNNDVEVPERFMYGENVCDHCGTKRKRNNLYIIRNTATGEFKQVGGSCLAVYTSGLDMEYIADYIDGITELEERNGGFCGSGKRYYSVQEVIKYAHIITKKIGYFKSSDYDYLSTKELVTDMLRKDIYASTLAQRVEAVNKTLARYNYGKMFSVADFNIDVDADVDAIINHYLSCEGNGEFIHNVQVMLNEGFVAYNCIGYLCYLPCGYARAMKSEAERAEQISNKHFGEVGKRYKDMPVENVRLVTQYNTDYGTKRIYNITLANGIVITWKTGNEIDEYCDSITFTIKEHNEYRGVKQTIVTRCKTHSTNGKAA